MKDHEKEVKEVSFQPIGVIHSPYQAGGFAPFQPLERDEGRSSIELFAGYEDALSKLDSFSYIYVLFYMHASKGEWKSEVSPPWAKGKKVGLFASRSPHRPNPVGLSIVQLKKIEGNTLHTSVIDAYDGTPVLDLKPYIKGLDSKDDANAGWVEEMDGHEHMLQHVRGIPHEHEEGEHHHHKHQHEHGDEHGHHHDDHHHSRHRDEDGHDE